MPLGSPSQIDSSAWKKWKDAPAPVLFWFIPALFGLYAKFTMLDEGRGFRLAARAMGRIEKSSGNNLVKPDFGITFLEKLSFFRMDMLVMFVLVPLGLWLLCRFLPRNLRTWTVGSLSTLTLLLLYIQMRALHVMGRCLSWQMIRTAISWGWLHPETITQYLKLKYLLLLCVAVAIFALAYNRLALVVRRWQASRQPPSATTPSTLTPRLQAGFLCAAVILPWFSTLPKSIYHESFLVTSVKALWNTGDVNTAEFAGLSRKRD